MIRDSPPELERALPGPYWSTRRTWRPRWRSAHAVQAPKAPAPTTTASQRRPGKASGPDAGRGDGRGAGGALDEPAEGEPDERQVVEPADHGHDRPRDEVHRGDQVEHGEEHRDAREGGRSRVPEEGEHPEQTVHLPILAPIDHRGGSSHHFDSLARGRPGWPA